MRQKCEYCGTHPEINDKGKCPNCGAPLVMFEQTLNLSRDIMISGSFDRRVHAALYDYQSPSGSPYNPVYGGIPVRYMGNDITGTFPGRIGL